MRVCLDKRTSRTHARFSGVLKYFRESESYKCPCVCARACFIVLYETAGFAPGNTNGRNAITQSVSALRSPCTHVHVAVYDIGLCTVPVVDHLSRCFRTEMFGYKFFPFTRRRARSSRPLQVPVPMNSQRVPPINFSELTANKRRTRPVRYVRGRDRNVH